MSRKKFNGKPVQGRTVEMVDGKLSAEDAEEERISHPLPWFVATKTKPQKTQKKLLSETMVEWHTASWTNNLIRISKKFDMPLPDPNVLMHTPMGSVFLRWEIFDRALEVIIGENRADYSIMNIVDGEEYFACLGPNEYGLESQGTVNTEEEIKNIWGWLTRHNSVDIGLMKTEWTNSLVPVEVNNA